MNVVVLAKDERTRRSILDGAAALLPRDSSASLGEVAAAVGVGRTTIHRYFPTREALLTALAIEAMDRLDGAVTACRLDDGPAPQVLARVARELAPMADEFRFLQVGPAVWDLPEMQDRWYRLADRLEGVVERGKREGHLRADLPTAWVVDLFCAGVSAAGDSVADGRIARNDSAWLVADVILHGVAPR